MRTRRASVIMAAVAAVLSLAARPCAADVPNPTPIDLGALPGCTSSKAYAINAAGQVVGYSQSDDGTVTLPFIWQNGVMAKLPLPADSGAAIAMSINDVGQIAGTCVTAAGFQACVWTRISGGWRVAELGVPAVEGGPFVVEGSWATRINNAGQVLAALFSNAYPRYCYAGLWQNGAWTVATRFGAGAYPLTLLDFPTRMNEQGQVLLLVEGSVEDWYDLWIWDGQTIAMPAQFVAYAALNDHGQVVGVRCDYPTDRMINFTYDISSSTLTSCPVGGDGYYLVNINDSGQVLAATQRADAYGGFLPSQLGITSFTGWGPTATFTPLGTAPGYVDMSGIWLNANGEVSGHSNVPGSAFFASISAGVVPLDDLDPTWAPEVVGMNDSGVIVGMSGNHAVIWASNRPPVAEAGPDQTLVATGATTPVTLDGSGSGDPDGDDLAYAWTENGAQIATGVSPSVQLAPGIHTLTLTVTDPYGATATDTVTVGVSALEISGATLTNNGKIFTITVDITNRTGVTVTGVTVTAARLDGSDSNSPLPLLYGALKPGASKQCRLQFKAVAPDENGQAILTISGACSIGPFFSTQSIQVK